MCKRVPSSLRFATLLTAAAVAAFADTGGIDKPCSCAAAKLSTYCIDIGIALIALGLLLPLRLPGKWRRKITHLLVLAAIFLPVSGSFAATTTTTGPTPIALACPVPNGTLGVTYSSHLVASGGAPPYTISIISGALPNGLTLDASTGAITGIPLQPGTAAFTAKVVDSLIPGAGGSPDSITASCSTKIAAPGLSIQAVSFFDNITLYKDTTGSITQITNPMWTSGGTNERVGYAGGSKMNVTLKLHVDTPPAEPISNVTIQGQAADVGNLIGSTPFTIPAAAGDITISGIIADTAFPKTTRYFGENSFTIDWSYTIKGADAISIGPTSHTVYVTLQNPIAGTKVYLTTINLAVSHDGADTEQFAFEQTWNTFFFGPANTTGWDGRPLYYYKPGIGFGGCSVVTVEPLLTGGNGQCTSWARLLMSTLAVNGISSQMYMVSAKDGQQFLVKDWKYGAAAAPPVAGDLHKYRMKFKTSLGEMVPSPTAPNAVYGNLTSLNTLAGQNSKPPSEKVFIRHFIVKYAPAGADCTKTDCYFDPSYGSSYGNEAAFQTTAVDGYLKQFPGDAANAGWVAKPAALNIKFKIF